MCSWIFQAPPEKSCSRNRGIRRQINQYCSSFKQERFVFHPQQIREDIEADDKKVSALDNVSMTQRKKK